ncbi:MAG: hypothetical protein E6767_10350 [Dysgonomonas sp.]|nr:hypothetical protein [Dysgonomonas sp.]
MSYELDIMSYRNSRKSNENTIIVGMNTCVGIHFGLTHKSASTKISGII